MTWIVASSQLTNWPSRQIFSVRPEVRSAMADPSVEGEALRGEGVIRVGGLGGLAPGSRLSALGSRLSALGSRLSALGSRLSALGSRLSALGSRRGRGASRPVVPRGGRMRGERFALCVCVLRGVYRAGDAPLEGERCVLGGLLAAHHVLRSTRNTNASRLAARCRSSGTSKGE